MIIPSRTQLNRLTIPSIMCLSLPVFKINWATTFWKTIKLGAERSEATLEEPIEYLKMIKPLLPMGQPRWDRGSAWMDPYVMSIQVLLVGSNRAFSLQFTLSTCHQASALLWTLVFPLNRRKDWPKLTMPKITRAKQ